MRLSDSAESSSRSGGSIWAPANGRATRSAASSSRDRSTRIDPPIGDPGILQKAQREQLVRFYRDWYRPNLMAVIVVGDIDRDAVVGMIKSNFSSLTNPAPARPRPNFDVPEKPATRYTIIADKETTATSVSISNLRPARPQDTVGGYRSDHDGPAVRRHARRAAR